MKKPREHALWLGLLAVVFVASLWLGTLLRQTRVAAPRAPEQTVQIKLRDLLDMVPRNSEQGAEIIQRLKAIEDKLEVIEQILRNTPGPPKPQVRR